MTRVILRKRGEIYDLYVKNHADTSIVCASISTLIGTLDNYIQVTNKQCLKLKIEPGNVHISWVESDINIIRFILIGFMALENTVPEEVKVEKISTFLQSI